MSNFLTNLAMRSFSSATGIRPRLASLFEPARAVPEALPGPDGLNWSHETVVVQDAEVETSGPGEEPERNSAATLKGSHKIGRSYSYGLADPSPEDDPSAQESFTAESRLQSAPGRIQQSHLLTQANPNTGALRFEENVSRSAISKSEEPRSRAPLGFPSQPEPTPSPTSPTTAVHPDGNLNMEKRRSASAVPRLTMTPELKSMNRERSKVAASSLVPNNAELQVALSSKLASHGFSPELGLTPKTARANEQTTPKFEQQRSEAEPSIHVTIGRVEVRAELAGNALRRADRTPSVVMGLEEYLQRRAKRGRE